MKDDARVWQNNFNIFFLQQKTVLGTRLSGSLGVNVSQRKIRAVEMDLNFVKGENAYAERKMKNKMLLSVVFHQHKFKAVTYFVRVSN